MAAREIGLLVQGDVDSPGELGDIRVIEDAEDEDVTEIPNLFVLSSALALPEVSEVIHRANEVKRLRGLLIDQERDPNWVTTMLDRAGVRTLRHTLVHHDPRVFHRVLNAWRIGAERELIADATLQDGLLLVKNCELDTFEVETEQLELLEAADTDELGKFEVAEDGAHLHWPDADIHLDLESIRAAIEPDLRDRLQAERLRSDELLGDAIRSLRKGSDIRQKDVPNISARQVRRVEKGETTPRVETLRNFAEAHGLTSNDYLEELAEEMRRLRRADAAE